MISGGIARSQSIHETASVSAAWMPAQMAEVEPALGRPAQQPHARIAPQRSPATTCQVPSGESSSTTSTCTGVRTCSQDAVDQDRDVVPLVVGGQDDRELTAVQS